MRPATKHWFFFAFLLLTLAAMVAFVLYQWSRLDKEAPAPAPVPPPVSAAAGPASRSGYGDPPRGRLSRPPRCVCFVGSHR